MYACQQGRDGDVRRILATKPGSASDRDRTLKTALHYCAENASPACASALLSVCPSLLDACDEEGYTPVHLAVISGNRSLLRLLVDKGADVTRMDREGHSAVHWATVCGEVEALEMVIAAGANPSTPDIHGGYPVHYAAQMCGANSASGSADPRVGLAVLRRLLAHKVKVDVTDKDGRQPILWAASAEASGGDSRPWALPPLRPRPPSTGSADAIIALVHAGATVEAHDKDGLTALHCAASRGHTDCLETLVTLCGAEVDVIDANGCTALFYAATLGHADSTRLLLGFGAQPNRQDRKGRTAAHCGAAKGQLETLRLLVAVGGADLWIRNVRGDLPLHEAVQSGRRELVRWLLQQRPAAVNAANNDGRSPLHVAAIHNNVEMCKVLLDSHSLVNPVMRTPRGQMATPLDTALLRGNRGCAKFLQLHGGVPASKLTEESARLRGGGPDGGSPAEMYLETGGPISARDPEGLGRLQMLPLTQPVGGHDSPPPDGFRSETYGGSISRATTMYPDGHTTAASYRTTEDKFIQVNDDIAIQYVERIRLSENDGDQEEEMEELSLIRGKVSHKRRLRGGDDEGGRSRREGEGTSEGEGGEVGVRRGRRGTSKKSGWGDGRGCIREEEEEQESEEEEEERESVSRKKKKSRRKRTTKRRTTAAKATTKKQEGLRRGRSREGEDEEEEEDGEEEEGVEEETEEEDEEDGEEDEEEEVVSEEEEQEEEKRYVGKKRKGEKQKVVKQQASGRESRVEKRRVANAVERTPSKRRPKQTSKATPTRKTPGNQSTSPEKTDGDGDKQHPSKIPVRKTSDRRPVVEERVTSKKRAPQHQHRSPDVTKKAVTSSASPMSAGKTPVKSSKRVMSKQKSMSVDEGVVAERRKSSVGRRKVGDGAEGQDGNGELQTDDDSPVKGTVQGTVQKVVAIVHKGGTSEEEGGSDEEDVIEQEKVKVEEDEELDEGVVFEEGPSEREERKSVVEKKEVATTDGMDEDLPVNHVAMDKEEEHEEENMAESITDQVAEQHVSEHVADSKEKVEEVKIQSEGHIDTGEDVEEKAAAETEVVDGEGTEDGTLNAADAAPGEQSVADEVDMTVSEPEALVTEETEESWKKDKVRVTASEMDDEETARADEVEARKMAPAIVRVAERDVDKVTSESEDVTKDRTEDDVSQLAEDTVSINEVRESPSKDEGISTFHNLTGGGRSESQEESEVVDGASTAEADISIETIVAAGDRKGGATTVCESEDEAEEHMEEEEAPLTEPELKGKKKEKVSREEEEEMEGEEQELETVEEDREEENEEDEEEDEEGTSQQNQRAEGEDRFASSVESSIFIPSLPLDRETPTTSSHAVEDSETMGARGPRRTGVARRGGGMARRRREHQKIGVRVEIGKDGAGDEVQRERRHPGRESAGGATGSTSVTQAVQTTVRKYHLERHIFSELLELKRLQIRAGRANENVLVKRLVDNFHGPAGSDLTVGIKRYEGQYTFRSFEKYLYDQLRMLQTGDPHIVPKLKPSDDMDKLKKMRANTAATCGSTPDNPAMCTHVTHRCHHAAHAYTGIPCAAYITKGGGHHHHDHHLYPLHSTSPQRSTTRSTANGSFLPRIDTIQDHSTSPFGGGTVRSRFLDPSRPVTLDLSQSGDRRQVISLPTQKVDKPKRYLVTFTIKPGSGSPDGVTITTKEGQVKVGPIKGDKSSPTLSDSPESDPTSFRHRHAKSL